ncbi:precorrin-6A/cobalt-precorrin-6A reductase [Marinovum sp.]|uniref:precorrin-6A/cobalt-precorrin-6A reductase n=1 Tax=Marinovum sp. TaxID=2024839 RepID=UPI002B272AA4|nr:precorrin-6A/cobalt-precorrin-6A reductase [Marinovum sp.]
MLARGTDILLIGGSAEARALADRLRGRAAVILPAPERRTHDWPLPVLSGPLDAALRQSGARLILDVSHPNDWQSGWQAWRASKDTGVPLLRLERPGWRPGRRDRWVRLRDESAAARHVARGARVFLATGREGLMRFANLREAYVISRQLSEHHDAFPLPRGRFLRGASPFSVAGEVALFRRLRIDWLILRNAGGPGGWPKLEAARRLGLRVGMIDRPRRPLVPMVRDLAAAEARIAQWLG